MVNKIKDNRPIGSIMCWKISGEYRNMIKIANNTNRNYISYSRWLIEQNINRKLKHEEIVHHINELTTDDRIENLKIMTISEHIQHHRKNKKPITAIKESQKTYKTRRDKISKKIIELYKTKSLRQISKLTKLNRNTITKIIKENGGIIKNGK